MRGKTQNFAMHLQYVLENTRHGYLLGEVRKCHVKVLHISTRGKSQRVLYHRKISVKIRQKQEHYQLSKRWIIKAHVIHFIILISVPTFQTDNTVTPHPMQPNKPLKDAEIWQIHQTVGREMSSAHERYCRVMCCFGNNPLI